MQRVFQIDLTKREKNKEEREKTKYNMFEKDSQLKRSSLYSLFFQRSGLSSLKKTKL
jgi:hypothetical protein